MKYIHELKNINLPTEKYAVFGSGPLAIRGLVKNADIDLIVHNELWDELRKKYPIDGDTMHISPHIDAFRNWQGFNAGVLLKDTEIIEEIPFVSIKKMIEWKEKRKKPKDLEHIRIAKEYLES